MPSLDVGMMTDPYEKPVLQHLYRNRRKSRHHQKPRPNEPSTLTTRVFRTGNEKKMATHELVGHRARSFDHGNSGIHLRAAHLTFVEENTLESG